VGGLLGEPAFGVAEIAAAEQVARVAIVALPVFSALEQAGVLARPFGQAVDRCEKRGEAGAELLVGANEDVVVAREVVGDREPVGLMAK
jgi:hypothetical protein